MKSGELGLMFLIGGIGLYWNYKKKNADKGIGNLFGAAIEIVNHRKLIIYDKSRAKYNAFVDGEQYKGDDQELLNKLFMGNYETLDLSEQNIKNIYLLIFYAVVGMYSTGEMSVSQSIEFLKLQIDEYKSKGWNIIKIPTKTDITNALEEMKVYRKVKWSEK